MKMNKKSVLCLLLSAIAVFSLIVPASAEERMYGDIDFDGEVTSEDARLALRGAVGLEEITGDDFTAADVDADGQLTPADARFILRWSVGLDGGDITLEEKEFKKVFNEIAHPYVGTYKPAFSWGLLKNFQKWCCYYTIHDTLRPTLAKLGYSEKRINELAPNRFPKEKLAAGLRNGLGLAYWPTWLVADSVEFYVPSLLMDYYYNHPELCQVYNFYDYYDDVVTTSVYHRDPADVKAYYPHVGDILFMSNKTRTYAYGYPTIDHTAQIMEVYPDGTFLCTEGSIIEDIEGDGIGKVRERTYHYNDEVGTWEFDYNEVVITLTAVRLDLTKK